MPVTVNGLCVFDADRFQGVVIPKKARALPMRTVSEYHDARKTQKARI